jgi:transposase
LEFGLATVPTMERIRRLGCAAAGVGRYGRRCRNAANDRQHHHPGTSLCGRRKGGTQNQALGRSRGGFSTKIHARANALGLPIGLILSPGEAHDVTGYDDLMEERDSDPGAMLGDKGYDSDRVRQDLLDRGAAPEIPTKRSRKVQYSVDGRLYALRARIECFFNKLKNNRRIATRYDQTSTSFLGFVLLGCIRIWIRFVHAA